MKIYNFEQRTEDWYNIRKGKMTASNTETIIANGKGLETYQKAEREEYERAINQDIQKSKNFVW